MKRVVLVSVALAVLAVPAGAAEANTAKGSVPDPNVPALGNVDYLGNPSGYHFWFTPSVNLGVHLAGHTYHNVYKFEVEDTSEWCGQTTVPNRAPYNLVADPGQTAWYKIFDTTTGQVVCGVD